MTTELNWSETNMLLDHRGLDYNSYSVGDLTNHGAGFVMSDKGTSIWVHPGALFSQISNLKKKLIT